MVRDRRWSRTEVILAVTALAAAVWLTAEVLFLLFAGILLATGIDAIADWLARRTRLSRGWSVAVVLAAFAAAIALAATLALPFVLDQLDELWSRLSSLIVKLRASLSRHGMLSWLGGQGEGGEALSSAAGWAMGLLGGLASVVIIIVIMVFSVAEPGLYRRGVLRLLPFEHRPRLDDTLSAVAHALRWWFLGQLASMAILGTTVSLGLLVIGVDLWLALGLITAVLTFIPFLGPIIAGIPVLAFAFLEGVETGLIVAVFYLVIQNVEGNLLTPWIQQRAVDLPPVLLIAVQVLMGTLFGVMGLVMAAPLAVLGMVMVQKLYVEDVLGDTGNGEG